MVAPLESEVTGRVSALGIRGGAVEGAAALAGAAPRSPVTGSPRRRASSVRRTVHLDASAGEGSDPSLVLVGAARDVLTVDDIGTFEVLDQARIAARTDDCRRIVALDGDPPLGAARSLVGARFGSGFRAQVADVARSRSVGALMSGLLDDLPVMALISGYASLRSAQLTGILPGALAPGGAAVLMADVCSGWRTGGAMMASVEGGDGVPLQDCPPAPSLLGDDPAGWHPHEPLGPGAMRRRRRIDVWWTGDAVAIEAMFRDSYGEPEGSESVLHEYAVAASVDPRSWQLTGIVADPRVLPGPECPLASQQVARLVGLDVRSFREVVPTALAGTAGCTHLNDLLRSFADVPHLAARATAI